MTISAAGFKAFMYCRRELGLCMVLSEYLYISVQERLPSVNIFDEF